MQEANIQIVTYEAQLNVLEGVISSLQASIEKDSDILGSIYSTTVDVEGDINNILEIAGLDGIYFGSGTMEYVYNEYNKTVAQYNSLRGQLNSAKAQYQEGLEEYTEAVITFEKEVEDAELQLKLARQELDELPSSEWIILDRDKFYSAVMYKNNTKQMASIGIYMPNREVRSVSMSLWVIRISRSSANMLLMPCWHHWLAELPESLLGRRCSLPSSMTHGGCCIICRKCA